MKTLLVIPVLALLLLNGCASYSPGEFDYSGPYPMIRFADGTEYELPSGNGLK